MNKTIKDLAWNVTEDIYRADEALSYSMLSTFFREGAKAIPTIRDPITSEAMRFGSLVDTMMTEPDELENQFFITDISKVSDTISDIVTNIFNATDKLDNNIMNVDRNIILMYINDANYYPNWKDDTRINKIISEGKDFYSLLGLAKDRTIISQKDYMNALECIETLKLHPFTSKYFTEDVFAKNIEYHYQLKFKYTDENYNVRCMFDRIIVDHNKKTIQPIDLKTTGIQEEDFESSFIGWSYWIQSNMYSQILKWITQDDDYFKDFKILPFLFIVINRNNLTPMVWKDNDSLFNGEQRLDKFGNVYPHWTILHNNYNWHVENSKYDYSYDVYQNKGVKNLTNLLLS